MKNELTYELEELILKAVKIRKSRGMTQKDIADISGLKQQHISKIETLKEIPTMKTFFLYIASIGCSITLIEDIN